MAKYRLLQAHELETVPMPVLQSDNITVKMMQQRIWLPGDKENDYLGEEKGTVVGDGTQYVVRWPTLDMFPLDADAEAMLDKERERLEINSASINPVDDLPIDNFEAQYIPGSNRRRGAPRPDGAPVTQRT